VEAAALKGEQGKALTKKQVKNHDLKKKEFITPFFLGRSRPRSFSPRLQSAVLPVKIIRLKKI